MTDDLFKQTISKLLEKAESDGVVTSEELELLDQVRIDAESYVINLEEAKSDGVITADESAKLERLRQMIIDRAEIVANIDGELSSDEKALLELLRNFIKSKFVH